MAEPPEPRRHRPITPEERAQIYRMADQGVPYRQIAETLARPTGTIAKTISDGILEGRVVRRYQRIEDRKA